MSNPVSPFRNNLFASRGMDIQSALDYAEMMINTLSSTDQVAVRTAFGVVINTIESAVTQSQGPKPVMDQADMLSQLGGMYDKLVSDVATFKSDWTISLIDERIAEHKLIREDAIGDVIDVSIDNLDDKIVDWMDENLKEKMMLILKDDDIDDQISNWMSNNFDLTDYDVDSAIESWMDNNIDEKIQDAISNIEFSVTVK